MIKLKKQTKKYFVNLFADFILSHFNKDEKTIIQVTEFENFIVVNGKTTSNVELSIKELTDKFFLKYGNHFSELNINPNTIDIIKYNQELEDITDMSINVNKGLYVEDIYDNGLDINISSEFPYGYSLNCGRSIYYYSHYIFNHMYSLLNTNNIYFKFSSLINDNEDYNIEVCCDSKINNDDIKNLILDVFDMDIKTFNEKLINYDLIDDIILPTLDKPFLTQDRLKDVILF